MIYLDNAATTFPKPLTVQRAINEAFVRYGANPGRGGYAMAMESAERVYACRELLAEMFGLLDPSGVIFTSNCTQALNIVVKGLLQRGDHVVISCYEHNSVIRPLNVIDGVEYTEAEVFAGQPSRTVESFKHAIRPNTRLILCTHASNVVGVRLPIHEIGELAQRYRIPFAVDAAQSAGILPAHMEKDHIDFMCMPGHKALYGPMGTGVLLCRGNVQLRTFTEGGTGSQSMLAVQPEELPDRFESGTLNVPGICGLQAGAAFVKQHGMSAIAEQETARMCRLYDALADMRGIRIYTPRPQLSVSVPLVTLNIQGIPSEVTASQLAKAGVAVRAGLHCAPTVHRRIGTLTQGAVRFCPSVFTTPTAVDRTAKILREIARKSLQSPQSMLQ